MSTHEAELYPRLNCEERGGCVEFLLFLLPYIAIGAVLALIIFPVALSSWVKKRPRVRRWKPVTATVLRIEAIDPPIGKDTVGPRTYRLDLVFAWQGLDWHRTWSFPRTYDLPRVGDKLSLLYDQKGEQFQLLPDPEETRKIARLRRRLLLLLILMLALAVLAAPLLTRLPAGTQWIFSALLIFLYFLLRAGRRRRLNRRIEEGELRPISAVVQGFRADREGEVFAYCRVVVHGEEREVTLPNIWNRHYTVGQRVTVHLDPETGEIWTAPVGRGGSGLIWFILILLFFLIGALPAFLHLS